MRSYGRYKAYSQNKNPFSESNRACSVFVLHREERNLNVEEGREKKNRTGKGKKDRQINTERQRQRDKA